MDNYNIGIYIIIAVLVIFLFTLAGFIGGYYSNDEVRIINTETIIEEECSCSMEWCLDRIKETDSFEKELYDKEWLQ